MVDRVGLFCQKKKGKKRKGWLFVFIQKTIQFTQEGSCSILFFFVVFIFFSGAVTIFLAKHILYDSMKHECTNAENTSFILTNILKVKTFLTIC